MDMSTALPSWFWGANQHGKNFLAAGDLVAKPGVGTGLHPDRPNFLVGASPRVARVIQYSTGENLDTLRAGAAPVLAWVQELKGPVKSNDSHWAKQHQERRNMTTELCDGQKRRLSSHLLADHSQVRRPRLKKVGIRAAPRSLNL